jgi:multiple sugar transport system ATP-binding protein
MRHLELDQLSKSFRSHKVLDRVSLAADDGEIIVVFGSSGTGKTVLLRLIAGVEEPTSGRILLDGRELLDLPPERRNVGMAFQNFALFPHMNAFDNIATPLRARGESERRVHDGVERVAKLLKIDHVLSHAPYELSNGQKQRTALARALAASPRLLLLDDPLRNVDAKLRFEMRLELPRLLRQSGATVLYVTQDYKEAMALGDRIAVLAEGRLVQVAAPAEIYSKPATVGVARLFGDPTVNLAPASVQGNGQSSVLSIGSEMVTLPWAYDGLQGRKVTLGIRPEAVELIDSGSGLEASVMAVTPLNERIVLLLQTRGGFEFLASLPSSQAAVPQPGSLVRTSFRPEGSHLFDRDTGERLSPALETGGHG